MDELSSVSEFLQRKYTAISKREKSARLREERLKRWSPILRPKVSEVHAGNESGVFKFVPLKQMGIVQSTNFGKYFKPCQ